MTVSAVVRKAGPTPGNSATTVFPFAFKVFADADVSVVKTVIASGAQSTLVLNDPLGYTIARNPDQNANPGGSITYNPASVPMPSTESLTIISVVPQAQGTHITNGGAFFAKNIEDAIDKAVVNVQDLAAKVGASVQFPAVDSALLNAILPTAALRALNYLFFDASGNVGVTPGSGASTPVSAAMAPVVAAATIPLARQGLGFNVQLIWAGTAGGTANALTLTPTPALETYAAGQTVLFKSSAAGNSGATTLAVSGQGAVAVQADGAACVGGEILASKWYSATYDGAAWQIQQIAPSLLLSLITAKGDSLWGTAAGKVTRMAVGANGSVPMARSADTKGVAYVAPFPKTIYGLAYANGDGAGAGDLVNDVTIFAGGAMDSTGAYWMTGAQLTKQLDVAWAVGNNAGGLDTGAIGNNDYYIHQIVRSDTGVVDYLFSLKSGGADGNPTMPANYDFRRLIGWFKRVGGTIVAFHTYETEGGGLELNWDVPTLDINLANTLTTARRLDAVKVPITFSVIANLNIVTSDAGGAQRTLVYNPDMTDAAPSLVAAPLTTMASIVAFEGAINAWIRTNAAGQVAARSTLATVDLYAVSTLAFRWARRN